MDIAILIFHILLLWLLILLTKMNLGKNHMLVYLKNTAFVLLLYLTNWPIGIKAMDSSLREKDSLIPKSYSSIREKEVNNNNPPKQGKPIENPVKK